jgi:hypothetical protein
MSQGKSEPDEDKEGTDAVIEPLLELVAGPESAADSRRRPGDTNSTSVRDDYAASAVAGILPAARRGVPGSRPASARKPDNIRSLPGYRTEA